MKKLPLIITLCVVAVFVIIIIGTVVSISNEKVDKKNLVLAQQDVCKANFDKMFKTIKQEAELAKAKFEVSKEAFKEIYPALIEGRYSKGDGSLMKWITESNPTFDLSAAGSLYDKLSVVIEANRKDFFEQQTKLIDYNREYKSLLNKWPAKWIVNRNDTVHIEIITSSATKDVYAKGEENDIDLGLTIKK
jgi:hypothetical protein